LPPLKVTDSLTRLPDSLKTGNAGYAIEAIPLKLEDRWIRIGGVDVRFGPLEIDAAWCISTQDEFQNIILKNTDAGAMLDKANAGEMLTCLPQQYGGMSCDNGYGILLMGGLKIGSPLGELFHFACQFGMAAMGPREFETAVRITGGFGPQGMLELGIEGRIKTDVSPDNPDSTHVHVDGNVYLSVAHQRFELGGNLDVVSGVRFSAGIHLEPTKHLLLEDDLTANIGQVRINGIATFQNIKLGTSATFDKRGVIFEAVKIIVYVGVGKVKFKAYENKAVLTSDQIALIRKGIEYIGKLPEASKQQTHFQQLLDRVPREQLLAQVRDGIDKDIQAIPTVISIGFEASAGFNASAVNVTVAVSYNARNLNISIPADLTRPDQLPAAISKAFADAYAKS
jgi:hypothetical protein